MSKFNKIMKKGGDIDHEICCIELPKEFLKTNCFEAICFPVTFNPHRNDGDEDDYPEWHTVVTGVGVQYSYERTDYTFTHNEYYVFRNVE